MYDPFATYQASDIDGAGATKYYGFVSRSGAWYIQEVTDTTIRYTKGTSGYVAAFTGRAGLTYDYYDEVFG